MNINKNPKVKRRHEISDFMLIADTNAENLAKLIYTLGREFPKEFYPKRQRDFVDAYGDSVEYIDEPPDKDIRAHKLDELMKDAPYISRTQAESILADLELSAKPEHRRCYANTVFREALAENIYLMLHTLHADFGFGEERISRVASAWRRCQLCEPLEWLEGLLGKDINEGCELEALKILDKRSYRTQQATLREQLDAQKWMDEFRRIMER